MLSCPYLMLLSEDFIPDEKHIPFFLCFSASLIGQSFILEAKNTIRLSLEQFSIISCQETIRIKDSFLGHTFHWVTAVAYHPTFPWDTFGILSVFSIPGTRDIPKHVTTSMLTRHSLTEASLPVISFLQLVIQDDYATG